MQSFFQKKCPIFVKMIIYHTHFHSVKNTKFEGACPLAETAVNTHCCDWLALSHCSHTLFYSFSCVLILEMVSAVIEPYMFELEEEER